MTLNDGDYVSIDLQRFIDRYRLPGECDECATSAAALATGYPDSVPEACATEGCRNYDAAYATHPADIDAEFGCFLGTCTDPSHRAPSDANPPPQPRDIGPN